MVVKGCKSERTQEHKGTRVKRHKGVMMKGCEDKCTRVQR